jgi:hypothetical protein
MQMGDLAPAAGSCRVSCYSSLGSWLTPVGRHASATERPSMPYAAHLDIRRQIAKIGARLELGESGTVSHVPKVEIGRILDLHA